MTKATSQRMSSAVLDDLEITREDVLNAIADATALQTKRILQYPQEVMKYLRKGRDFTSYFVKVHRIKLRNYLPGNDNGRNSAKFVHRADIDRALERMKPI